MSSNEALVWFRERLEESRAVEERDPESLLSWLHSRRLAVNFSAELIPLREARNWSVAPETLNVSHTSGMFFSIEAARTTTGSAREVASWDQPIYVQKSGGVLALLAKLEESVVYFLLNAKAEPGNIDKLQLSPTVQASWSNLQQAHKGPRPPYADIVTGDSDATLIYRAMHNEEGSRFWLKSNSNEVHLINPETTPVDSTSFAWATLSQIKALCLQDNVVNPYVKTVIAPL